MSTARHDELEKRVRALLAKAEEEHKFSSSWGAPHTQWIVDELRKLFVYLPDETGTRASDLPRDLLRYK